MIDVSRMSNELLLYAPYKYAHTKSCTHTTSRNYLKSASLRPIPANRLGVGFVQLRKSLSWEGVGVLWILAAQQPSSLEWPPHLRDL